MVLDKFRPTAFAAENAGGSGKPLVLLTLAEVQQLLRVSTTTIYRYKNNGILPKPVRPGGRNGPIRYRYSDILDLINRLASDDPDDLAVDTDSGYPDPVPVKRKRGRPRKIPALAPAKESK